jgi:murein DD-endopeptidase MepM/ murein hydrolase activator NlpD
MTACGSDSTPAPAKSAGADIALAAETIVVRNVVPRNTTLDGLLREHGFEGDTVGRVVSAMTDVFDPRKLRSLQPFLIERSTVGALRLFEYEIDADHVLRVSAGSLTPALSAEVVEIPKTVVESTAAGVIDEQSSSLFAAMKTAGERDDLAIALAQIFSGEIDFNTEIRRDDRFAVAFERYQREGRPDTYGKVIAAEFQNDGRVIRAIRFTLPDGKDAFYDENGRSLRRFFLKSPLKFEPRVTSGFSLSRRHPVLHTSRAHRGVDYAAPTGAPVISIAAGTVLGATYDNANGRMVRVRHTSGYESYYLHLSRFAPGIRAGVRVGQGDLVGFVGSTGLSTGPHLHYGLKKNGVFVNPIAEHRNMPPGEPVPASLMKDFNEVRDRALASLGEASAKQGAEQEQARAGSSPAGVDASE